MNLDIPVFVQNANYATPFKRHLVGAVRYEFEVRLHSVADIKTMFRGLLTPSQVDGILRNGSFSHIPARMCSLSWLHKQMEKQK